MIRVSALSAGHIPCYRRGMSGLARDRLSLLAAAGLLAMGFIAWSGTGAGATPFPTRSLYALWFAALGLFGGTWLTLQRRQDGHSDLIAATVLAGTAPLTAVPLVSTADPLLVSVGLAGASAAMLPLARQLTQWISSPNVAAATWACAALASAIAVFVGIAAGRNAPTALNLETFDVNVLLALRWLIAAAAITIPAAIAVSYVLTERQLTSVNERRITTALGIAAAAAVPVATSVALTSPGWQFFALPLFAAAATAGLLARVAIRPLAREAGTAVAQRDLVIAAAEAERNRLATALHDGPLGDLALLIQRLDSAGDGEAAASARAIADDLRSIGNDLQLPILDDLGLPDALEWLVGRVGRRAAVEVELNLDAPVRPPTYVERALYRITQEALLNAIKHGQPPVTVSYQSTIDGLTLRVEDRGPGMERAAPGRAVRDGRLGLLSMTERAEAIGARLQLANLADGGTRVRLDWRPASA